MKVWCDSIWETAIGKTKATFDPVDSNQNTVKIQKPDAKAILGFLVAYNLTVVTDGEITPDLILRVTNKALGISNEDIIIPNGGCDGNATNDWAPLTTVFVPFNIPEGSLAKLFNSEFVFTISPSASNTGGLDVVIGVVFADEDPDSAFAMELLAQKHSRVRGGAFSADAAKAHATGLAFVDLTSIEIPSGRLLLLGLLAKINPNGIAASDPINGVIEFKTSGIPDFSPQVWPLCTAWNPVLGTTVSEQAQSGEGRYYPTRFPLTGSAVTVLASSMIIVAAAGAPDTTQGLLYE